MGRRPSEDLTAHQARVLDFIKSQEKSPTLKQIADHVGWSSMTTAAEVVNTLIRRGRLARRRKSRTLRVIEAGPA